MFNISQRIDKALQLFERLVISQEKHLELYEEVVKYDRKVNRPMRKLEHDHSIELYKVNTKLHRIRTQAETMNRVSSFMNLDKAWGSIFPSSVELIETALWDFAEEMSEYLEKTVDPPTLQQLDQRSRELELAQKIDQMVKDEQVKEEFVKLSPHLHLNQEPYRPNKQ
jgi:hypothetical protein